MIFGESFITNLLSLSLSSILNLLGHRKFIELYHVYTNNNSLITEPVYFIGWNGIKVTFSYQE